MSKQPENISSAEMTAYWRSAYPELSGDNISHLLTSKAGIEKAAEFIQRYDYPLIDRKVSARAGFIKEQAAACLTTGNYDGCISLGSGFSLLSYLLAHEFSNKKIVFIDVDLPEILNERKKRLMNTALNPNILKKIKMIPCNLEQACAEKKTFKELFKKAEQPIFILEGLIYFLSQNCVNWIIKEIAEYKHTAIILDCFPENLHDISACFRRMIASIKGFIPENIQTYMTTETLNLIDANFNKIDKYSVQAIENNKSKLLGQEPKLIDQNQFFPVHLITAKK